MPIARVDTLVGGRLTTLRSLSDRVSNDLAKSAKISNCDYELSENGARRFRAVELFRIARELDITMSDILAVLNETRLLFLDDHSHR